MGQAKLRDRPFRTLALIIFVTAAGVVPGAGATSSSATIALSPYVGPPTTFTEVSGKGFGPTEMVDLSFGDLAHSTVVTDGAGSFRARRKVPRDALPGIHPVDAVGRTSGERARAPFLVRTDWVQEGWTASHTGHNIYENVLDPSNVGDLSIKWLTTGLSTNDAATIVGGVVYAASGDDLVALRASNGQLLWSTTLENAPTTPAVSHGMVYTGTFGGEGRLYALDAATGAIRWRAHIGNYVNDGPTVADGRVYISGHGWVYAFDAQTGAHLWRTDTGSLEGGTAVSHSVAYVHTQGTNIVALNAETGQIRWEQSIGYGFSTPAVSGGSVFVGGDYAMFAFDARTGEALWEASFPEVNMSPAVAYGLVYAGGGDGLYAFDAETGAVAWTGRTGDQARSDPAVANGVVYIWAWDNTIYAFDALTGEKLWNWHLEGINFSHPAPTIADGVLYIASNGLYAFALP
jgi:outer membrane protein assembly factor BamB